jgi:DNA-binding NarL/FixJ family response regulator
MDQITIILADPQPLVREGTRLLLSQDPDFKVIASLDSSDMIPGVLETTPANIVLMDAVMPGCSPVQTARLIRKQWPATHTAFLTAYADDEYLIDALDAGAVGYILKESSPGDLTIALHEINRGSTWVSPRLLAQLVQDYRARGAVSSIAQPRSATLTPREKEVLKLLAEGYRVKDVAVNLKLSVKTIEAHKFNLMRKLDIHNKAQLVQYAFQKRIIPLHSVA